MAEVENVRRRAEKEVADARTYGASNFARDMLTFADNLARALENAPKDADGALKTMIEGVGVIAADFQSRLARHGVKKMEPQGQKFDPNLHEALFEIPDDSPFPRARCCRWWRPATRSATGCCGRPRSAFRAAARRPESSRRAQCAMKTGISA